MKGRPRKFTAEEEATIRYLYSKTAHNLSSLARLFRTSPGTISRIVTEKGSIRAERTDG